MKAIASLLIFVTVALLLAGCTDSAPSSTSSESVAEQAAAEAEAAADEAEAALAAASTTDTGSRCKVPTQEDSETFGLILNLNSLLCAKVVRVCPLEVRDALEVTCIEYRGGSATKTYILDTKTATAFEQ